MTDGSQPPPAGRPWLVLAQVLRAEQTWRSAHAVMPALGALEKFLHDDPVRTPTRLKLGLAHAQFETIHPFLDGNGRIGRLLITLLFVAEGVLAEPLLYASLYFKQHQREYYDRLQRIRTDGDWEGWMSFYLDGVAYVAEQATTTAGKLVRLFDADGKAALGASGATQSTPRVFELLRRRAVLTIPAAAKELSLSKPTVGKAVSELEKLGIAREITGKRRDRQFLYGKYIDLMNEDVRERTIACPASMRRRPRARWARPPGPPSRASRCASRLPRRRTTNRCGAMTSGTCPERASVASVSVPSSGSPPPGQRDTMRERLPERAATPDA